MVSVNAAFWGPARDLAGVESASLQLPDGATVADVRRALVEQFPGLRAAMSAIRFAVNESFVPDETVLSENDELALIPPVSGGAEDGGVWVGLVHTRIPEDRVRAFVAGDDSLGAIATFEGVTRRDYDEAHGYVVRLAYEAYEAMAVKQIRRLVDEARARWSLGRVALIHRLGTVEPAEASVLIAVAAGHRAESFESCRWLIEMLKRDVPIWKKDVYEDGFIRWVEPASAQPGAGRNDC